MTTRVRMITEKTVEKYVGKTILFTTKMKHEIKGEKAYTERIVEKVERNGFFGLMVTLKSPVTGVTEAVVEGESEQGMHGFSEVLLKEI